MVRVGNHEGQKVPYEHVEHMIYPGEAQKDLGQSAAGPAGQKREQSLVGSAIQEQKKSATGSVMEFLAF